MVTTRMRKRLMLLTAFILASIWAVKRFPGDQASEPKGIVTRESDWSKPEELRKKDTKAHDIRKKLESGKSGSRQELQRSSSSIGTQELPGKDVTADEAVYNVASNKLLARYSAGNWVVQGDIMVDERQLVEGLGDSRVKIANINSVDYWAAGRVPYVIGKGVDSSLVQSAIDEFNKKTLVRFVEYSGEKDFVAFEASDDDVCQSYLGRKGGKQSIKLHSSCARGQVIHELMHVLGFVHEHSRADRDSYIEIAWDNIEQQQKNQFQKLPSHISMPVKADFDFDSILLYSSTAFSVNGEKTIKTLDESDYIANREELSEIDVKKVNRLTD